MSPSSIHAKGLEKGLAQGTADTTMRLNKLKSILADYGRIEDLVRAAKDPAFQQQLLEEFGI